MASDYSEFLKRLMMQNQEEQNLPPVPYRLPEQTPVQAPPALPVDPAVVQSNNQAIKQTINNKATQMQPRKSILDSPKTPNPSAPVPPPVAQTPAPAQPDFRSQYMEAIESDRADSEKLALIKALATAKDGMFQTGATIRAKANPDSSTFASSLDAFKPTRATDLLNLRKLESEESKALLAGRKAQEDADFRERGLDLREREISERQQQRSIRNISDLQTQFASNKETKDSLDSISNAKRARNMLNAKNPFADGSIPMILARAAGEVGALTEGDKAPFKSAQDLMSRLAQVNETYLKNGLLTDDNRRLILELTDYYEKTGEDRLNRSAARFAAFGEERGLGTFDENMTFLKGRRATQGAPAQNTAPAPAPTQAPSSTPPQTKVIGGKTYQLNPATGKYFEVK